MKRATRLGLVWSAAAAALLVVFSMYLRPEMLMTLATQLWNCL